MQQFTTYEEENIHYWTNRASGSEVRLARRHFRKNCRALSGKTTG